MTDAADPFPLSAIRDNSREYIDNDHKAVVRNRMIDHNSTSRSRSASPNRMFSSNLPIQPQ
jgi:hypothetical protein